MSEIFNNREIAIGIWVAGLTLWALTNAKIRTSIKGVIKCLFQRLILLSLGLMALYIGLMVYLLYLVDLWALSQLKNTIMWSLTVGAVSLFSVNKVAEDPKKHLSSAIKDTFRLIALLEFIITFYNFPLWAEMLLVPVATLLVLLQVFSERDEKHAAVKRLADSLLMWMGIGLIVYAVYMLVIDFRAFANPETLHDFSIPPILTLMYLPFVAMMAIYMSYETAKVRVYYAIKPQEIRDYALRKARFVFHCRVGLLKRWTRNVSLTHPETKEEVNNSIKEVIELRKREKNPQPVPIENGWSPYIASKFLESLGIVTNDYHEVYGEWFALSPYLEIGDGIMPNNIAYYIEGNSDVATKLKLKLNVNELESADAAKHKFIEISTQLFWEALKSKLPEDIKNSIQEEAEVETTENDKAVSLSVERWPNHHSDGYEMSFVIRNKDNNKST